MRIFTKEHREKLSIKAKNRDYGSIKCMSCDTIIKKNNNRHRLCRKCAKQHRKDYINVLQNKRYYKDHQKTKKEARERGAKYRKAKRLEVISALGGKCVKCGFSDWRALQIDHVNSDGAWERTMQSRSISAFHNKVIREKDKGRYQLLCANCNWIKRYKITRLQTMP